MGRWVCAMLLLVLKLVLVAWQGAEEEETLHLEDFILCAHIQILKFRCERFFFQHVAYFFVSTYALSSW